MKRLCITTMLLIVPFVLFSQVRCNYCKGNGYVIEEEYKTCTNCGGQGERSYTETITKTCTFCNGTKQVETRDKDGKIKKKYCTHCEDGKVTTTTKYIEICPKCDGRGKCYVDVEKRCPRCGGSGKEPTR